MGFELRHREVAEGGRGKESIEELNNKTVIRIRREIGKEKKELGEE